MRHKWPLFFALFCGVLLAAFRADTALAYFDVKPTETKIAEMNGIRFDEYKNFTGQWHLVTVRYRKDSSEMRFVYANDLAFEGLKQLKPHYADGAAFGKIGLITESDPSFASSVVPASGRRFQFMVKDKKKYAGTNGWGYALFDSSGVIYADNVKKTTEACAACHRVVPERDFIFSRLAPLTASTAPFVTTPSQKSAAFHFVEKRREQMPAVVAGEIAFEANDTKDVIDDLQGQIQKNAFAGTLDEVVPLLIEQMKSGHRAATFIIDKKNFSLIEIQKHPVSSCVTTAYHLLVHLNGRPVRNTEICQ